MMRIIQKHSSTKFAEFTSPIEVVTANTISEILPALRRIEDLVNTEKLYACGFITYDASPAFDPALVTHKYNGPLPLLCFGLYKEPNEHDLSKINAPTCEPQWQSLTNATEHESAMNKIHEYILDGRCYQVNFTGRFSADFKSDSLAFFKSLVDSQPSDFSCFIDDDEFSILSVSPELFFELDGDALLSKPMKGTIARGLRNSDDISMSRQLQESPKDRAENLMIVDMIRNDMGRIAEAGSVNVEELFAVEKYPTLWQMTSTVSSKTSANVADIFGALFPCASITGAPKVESMKIIRELESSARGIYTGAIGTISPNRKARFSVAIRTVEIDKTRQTAIYGTGGGIVHDSKSENEYEEFLLKAKVLSARRPDFQLIETMLWEEASGVFLLDDHIDRMRQTAKYFGFPFCRKEIVAALNDHTKTLTEKSVRLRLLLDKAGVVQISSTPFCSSDKKVQLGFSSIKIHSDDPFIYHKTTNRKIYETAAKSIENCDDVILVNGKNEVTETTIANIVIEKNGGKFTPPMECGLLPGVFRDHLLNSGVIEERVITLDEMRTADKIYRINSVRKWEECLVVNTLPICQ